MTPIELAIFLALLCAIYLLPSILAAVRGHASAWGIFILNLLLGWSGIVWIIALVWALSNKGQAIQQTFNVNQGGEAPQPIYIPVPVPQHPPSAQEMMGLPASPLPILPMQPIITQDTRACPSCAETIKAAAIKCRYCGDAVTPTTIEHGPGA